MLDLLRQQGDGRLQLVLDLHLGDVDVGAALEGQGDCRRPGAVAGRTDVLQPIQTLHLLLDDLSYAVLDRLGRGAGVDGLDRNLGERDIGVLGEDIAPFLYRLRAE